MIEFSRFEWIWFSIVCFFKKFFRRKRKINIADYYIKIDVVQDGELLSMYYMTVEQLVRYLDYNCKKEFQLVFDGKICCPNDFCLLQENIAKIYNKK